MAAISTLIDSFNNNSVDAIWTTLTTNGTVTETSEQLVLTPTPSGTGDVRLISASAYDMTSSGVILEVISYANITGCDSYFTINVNADFNNNRTSFLITDDGGLKLVVFYKVAGVLTTLNKVAYDATAMRWLRTREQSGTIYWDYSPDAVTWTNHSSVANPWAVTNVQLTIGVNEFTGIASPATFTIDNVNTTSRDLAGGFYVRQGWQ